MLSGWLEMRCLTLEYSENCIYSNLDEQTIINGYLNTLSLESRYCVDIGASDGISMSNAYPRGVDSLWNSMPRSFLLLQEATLISRMSIWRNVW